MHYKMSIRQTNEEDYNLVQIGAPAKAFSKSPSKSICTLDKLPYSVTELKMVRHTFSLNVEFNERRKTRN